MSLLDVIRNGVAIADSVTKPLQEMVSLEHISGPASGSGDQGYNAPVSLPAIVDWKQRHLRTANGELSVSRASVLFLDIDALSAATNDEGIADNDKITLADGTTGPILDMGGFIDAGTGRPFATEVFLG